MVKNNAVFLQIVKPLEELDGNRPHLELWQAAKTSSFEVFLQSAAARLALNDVELALIL